MEVLKVRLGTLYLKNYPSSESKLGFVFIEKTLDKSPHIEDFFMPKFRFLLNAHSAMLLALARIPAHLLGLTLDLNDRQE